MMVPVVMPKIGLTIEEVEVVEWFHAAGESVVEGEPLVTVNADKSDVVVDAPTTGTIDRIVAEVGSIVAIGGELALIAAPGGVEPATGDEHLQDWVPPAPEWTAAPQLAPAAAPGRTDLRPSTRTRISPYARRLARERKVVLTTVLGSGPGGRIVARDIPTSGPAASPPGPANARPIASLAASADAVEMIAVTLSHPRVRIIHLVSWAVARSIERLRPEWIADGNLLLDIDRPDSRSSTVPWSRSLSFQAWLDRVDEVHTDAASPLVRVVDVGVDDVEPGVLSDFHPAPLTLVFAGVRIAQRVRDDEVVMRPRLPLTATYDPTALGPTDAARLIAATADRLSRIGVLLDALPNSWQPPTH